MTPEKKPLNPALDRFEKFLADLTATNPPFIEYLIEQFEASKGEGTRISGGTDLYSDKKHEAVIHDDYSLVPKKSATGTEWFVNLCRKVTYKGVKTRTCSRLTIEEFQKMYGDEVLDKLTGNTKELLAQSKAGKA